MTAQGEVSNTLDEAFRAAFLLTGSTELAENAVLDGIAALECGDYVGEILVVESIKSAIRQRADLPGESEQALSRLPWELRRLNLLAPISRDCFVLRVLLRLTPGSSAAILQLTVQEIEEVLCAAFEELPLLEACNLVRN